MGAQKREGGAGCVGRQVVGRNDLTGPEGRGALVGDASLEAGAGHRTVTAPWRDQAVLGKARDEGLGVPVAEGGMIEQARADGGAAGGLAKAGLQAGFVDEDQPFQHVGHIRLEGSDPDLSPRGRLGPQDFAGAPRFS